MTVYDDNADLYEDEDPKESPTVDEPILDPDNPEWHLLPVRRGVTDRLVQVWNLCQEFGAFIIGGYVRMMISPDEHTAKSGDIDVFMDDRGEHPSDVLARYNDFRATLMELFPNFNQGPLSTYFFNEEDNELAVNLVIPRIGDTMITMGTIYEILSRFDFPVVRCGLKSLEVATVDPDFLEDEGKKQLRWKWINCPIAAVYRMLKYRQKGYFARPREVIKLFIDWEERDEQYKQDLITAIMRDDPTEQQIMDLEQLLWVD